jgi:hypothetical protein
MGPIATGGFGLYHRFVALVAGRRERHERDALTQRGREVLHYRMETFRQDLQNQTATQAATTKVQGTVALYHAPGRLAQMAELVATDEGVAFAVAIYHPETGAREGDVRIEREVVDGTTRYLPPMLGALSSVVYLPTVPEPYGSGAELAARLTAYYRRHAAGPAGMVELMTAYTHLAWVYDHPVFEAVPYMGLAGAPWSGKSTAMKLMAFTGYRAVYLASPTPAVLFRLIELVRGLVLLDDLDFDTMTREQKASVYEVLERGYEREGQVVRNVAAGLQGKYDLTPFSVYGPKVIANREGFGNREALDSRTIPFYLPPRIETPDVVDITEATRAEGRALRNELLAWRFDTRPRLFAQPAPPRLPAINPRMSQVLQSLQRVTGWWDPPPRPPAPPDGPGRGTWVPGCVGPAQVFEHAARVFLVERGRDLLRRRANAPRSALAMALQEGVQAWLAGMPGPRLSPPYEVPLSERLTVQVGEVVRLAESIRVDPGPGHVDFLSRGD